MSHFLVSPSLLSPKPNQITIAKNSLSLSLSLHLPEHNCSLTAPICHKHRGQHAHAHTQTHKSFKNETRKHETGKKKTLNATSELRKEEPELQKRVVV
jgi:hypothetical protein